MLSDEVIDKVVEKLAVRMEQANEYVLQEMGKSVKKIGTLSPSKAQQLVQIMRYGGDYDKIVRKLKEITKMNVRDIQKIFEEVAKNDYQFAEQFYKYRNKKYIPWEENNELQRQVKALAKITANEYTNLTNTLAFATYDKNGKIKYTKISKMYQQLLDEAVLNVGQGKESFDSAMYRTLKQLGESGIRTVDYPSGRSMRADSAMRMQAKGALREMHNEIQQQFGEEFGADGVEISVHLNPAPDHSLVQGKQFSKTEFEKFQNDIDAISYDGVLFPAEFEGRDRRSISEYNCYHYIFSIVLGVSRQQYSNERLKQIIENNEKGFEFEGKHYTNYEGTQLQRKLETEIRKQKDTQILARASGNDRLIYESQQKITQLTNKYRELSKASGLPTSMDRMRVSGYRRTKVSLPNNNENKLFNKVYIGKAKKEFNYDDFIDLKPKNNNDLKEIGEKYFNFESNEALDFYVTKTSKIKERITNGDIELKRQLDLVEPEIDKLAEPSPIGFKLYSAKDITTDYTKSRHLMSATISEPIAKLHINKKINKEVITIYVEKGAKIVSTVNTSNKQFNRQGEIIIPSNRKLEKIDKYNYILLK